MTEDRQKAEILRQELDAKKAAIREQKQKKQQTKTEDVEMQSNSAFAFHSLTGSFILSRTVFQLVSIFKIVCVYLLFFIFWSFFKNHHPSLCFLSLYLFLMIVSFVE